MFGEISANFEAGPEYFAISALQQALEELHYRDFRVVALRATLTHQLGVPIHQ